MSRSITAVRMDNRSATLAQDALVRAQPALAEPVFRPIEGASVAAELIVSALDSVLAQPTTAPAVVGGAPLLASRVANVFRDAGEDTLLWHLPDYQLAPDPDASFRFDARQDVADDHGHPFNIATLTLAVRRRVPADATATRDAQPGSRLQQIPIVATDVTLHLAFKDAGGNDEILTIAGSTSATVDGLLLTFTGLVGDTVILAFTDLTVTAAASVSLTLTYIVDDVSAPPPPPDFASALVSLERTQLARTQADALVRECAAADARAQVVARSARSQEEEADREFVDTRQRLRLLPQLRRAREQADAVALESALVLAHAQANAVARTQEADAQAAALALAQAEALARAPTTIRRSTTTTVGVPIGAKFAGSAYRQRYTVTSAAATRAIINTDDLERFNVVQSEFQELTALGDVGSRYPSLRALYVGLVSGTIVAVPAAYGIQRTPLGCEASCDALVDSGSAMNTGCRFHLSFTLTPAVDPGDLVRLSTDLRSAPTLPSRDWQIVLPSDLDRRTEATFASPFVNTLTFGVGTSPHTFLIGADIVDDTMPAVVKVNAFLRQLTATGPPPLLGRLPVRLDDAHTPAVEADLILDLHTTGGDQELVIDSTQREVLSVRNVAPYDVRLTNYTSQTTDGFLTTPLDEVVAGGATTTLSPPAGSQVLTVHRSLALPDPTPPALLAHYVRFRTTDVQRIHHLLGVNAHSVLGGPLDHAVTTLTVTITLNDAPELLVPTLVLDPTRPADRATVDIPVQSAFTGLDATVTIAVARAADAQPKQISLTHDFVASPILVLTPAQLAAS